MLRLRNLSKRTWQYFSSNEKRPYLSLVLAVAACANCLGGLPHAAARPAAGVSGGARAQRDSRPAPRESQLAAEQRRRDEAREQRTQAAKDRAWEAYGKLPLSFEANEGQADASVRFVARGSGYTILLTPREAVMVLADATPPREEAAGARRVEPSDGGANKSVLRMRLVGANPRPEVTGDGKLPGATNYFIGGDPAKWRANVPSYGRVKYAGVYPGVDAVYYGKQRELEYDLNVAPGADPDRIVLEFAGARRLSIGGDGDLVLKLKGGELRQHKPFAYQVVNGERREVASRYVSKGRGRVGFELGGYDPRLPLVIDPVLSYSTYLGGYGQDRANGITVDSSGSAYVTGSTDASNFPVLNAAQGFWGGGTDQFGTRFTDVFVTKFSPSGSSLVYSTYLGGNQNDSGADIAVDAAGNAYVVGSALSGNFPRANAMQQTSGGGYDAFLTKLGPAGNTLVYSTYIGGAGSDSASAVALDASNNVYIQGATSSTNFPTVSPVQSTLGGLQDTFAAKVNAAGSALVYSTYLGGASNEYAGGIAVDSSGSAYLTGATTSANFPTASPVQAAYSGGTCNNSPCMDAFVTKLSAAGSALVYSTYLGGSQNDIGNDLTVDSAGNAYVTGDTGSANFPLVAPLQSVHGGGQCAAYVCADIFVTKYNAAGSAITYSTFIGGNNDDNGRAIALDSAGNIFIGGETSSPNFPVVNPLPGDFNCCATDAAVVKLNPSGTALLYSTYFGGSSWDFPNDMALDSAGAVYIAGFTQDDTNFPLANAYQTTHAGGSSIIPDDAFVAKISDINGPRIGGRIADAGGNPVPGVAVSLTGSQSADVLTDADGNYSFPNLSPGGNFVVRPSKALYTFNPASQSVSNLTSDQTVNFTATATSVTVSGKVMNGAGTGISAVTVNLTGAQTAAAQTDAAGNYSFPNLPAGGSYTVTPTRAADTFSPASKTFNNLGSNQTVNFTLVYRVGGRVTDATGAAVPGVTLTLSGTQSATTQTDASGNYSFANLGAGGNYTVTPSKPGYTLTYTFSPAGRTYNNLAANQIVADFSLTGTATLVTLNAIADAYVQDGTTASTNFGAATTLNLKSDKTANSGLNRDVYLKFDLAAVSRSVTNVKLRIYAAHSSAQSLGTAVHSVADTLWGESTITWNNKPARSATALAGATATVSGTAYAAYDLDVTNYVKAELLAGRSVVSLALHNPTNSTTNITVFSRENADNKPRLVVTAAAADNSPPTISLTAPAAGATYAAPASITLSASASDSDGQIARVDFYAGTALVGTATSAPYTVTWPNVGTGQYGLTAVATDNAGAARASSTVDVSVVSPNAAPAVALTAPAANTAFPAGSTVTLAANASDTDGQVTKVEFFAGTTLVGTATSAPYSINWANAAAGAHSLTAKATDNSGATTTSAAVPVNVIWQTGLSPTADAYVADGASAATNFGTAVDLQTRSAASGSNRESYLKFDLATASNVTGAKLRVYGALAAAGAANVPLAVHSVSNTTWVESGTGSITWNTKPPAGATALASANVADNVARWHEFDVTAYVKGEKDAGRNLVTFVLKNTATASTHVSLASKEAASARPQLVLTTTAARNVLLVTASATLTPAETNVRNRLQGLGFTVTVKAASTATAVTSADANGKALVVVSSTVAPANVTNKFRHSAVPVLTWEFDILDDQGMTGTVSGTDFGTATNQTLLSIVTPAHPMAAGLSGNVNAASVAGAFTWGKPNANAVKVAALTNDATRIAVFGYDNAAAMPGLAAPARRVAFFFTDATAATTTLTNDGWLLFDAAVSWACDTPVAPTAVGLSPTSGPPGTSVTLTGYNFGAAQGAGTLTFNGVAANVSSWNSTAIVAPVPAAATTGPVVVTVNGLASNGLTFTVELPPADTDADGLPDAWEMLHFGNLAQGAAGDPDGDGLSNLQEYQQGRNPTKPAQADDGTGVNLKVHTPLVPPGR